MRRPCPGGGRFQGKRSFSQKGVALLMALAAIAIATILVVGILALTSRERLISRSMANNQRTGLLCQVALEHATALLDKNIPQPVPPGTSSADPTNWIVNPGLLTLVKGGSTVTEIPLSSDPSPTYVPVAGDANLNQKNYDGNYPIRKDGTPLRVGWVNVLQDPSLPAASGNPIIGRYAFWMDDESAKVNINMAYGKPEASKINLKNVNPLQQDNRTPEQHEVFYYTETYLTGENDNNCSKHHALPWDGGNAGYGGIAREDRKGQGKFSLRIPTTNTAGTVVPTYYPMWHPAAINLDELDPKIDRDALTSWTHNITNNLYYWRLLNSPQEIKKFITPIGDADSVYEDIKFDITTKSRSPEFNVFGKSRLFLENRSPLWEANQFFQFSYDKDGPVYFHGTETGSGNNGWNPNINGVQMVANSISDKLARSDWPGISGSFVQKWGGDEKARREADQVAWNMVAWGTYAADRYAAYDVDGRSNNGFEVSEWKTWEVHDPWSEDHSLSSYLQNMAPAGHPQSVSQQQFNRRLFRGKLSGKAILPWFPRPLLSEIFLSIRLVGVDRRQKPDGGWEYFEIPVDSLNFGTMGFFILKLQMWYEVHNPDGMNPIRSGKAYGFLPSHLEYQVQEGSSVTSKQDLSLPSVPNAWDVDRGSGPYLTNLGGRFHDIDFLLPGRYYAIEGNNQSGNGTWNSNVFYAAQANELSIQSQPVYGNGIPTKAYRFTNPVVTLKNFRVRLVVYSESSDQIPGEISAKGDGRPVFQIVPVWDTHDSTAVGGAFTPPAGEKDYIEFPDIRIDVNSSEFLSGNSIMRSMVVDDPRNGLNSSAWRASSSPSIGNPSSPDPESGGAASKFTFFDFQRAYYNSVSGRPSIGMLSTVPIGMQRNIPFATPKFQPGGGGSPPDWLMLDFVAPSMRPHTFMNSTMGKINLNAKLHGGGTDWENDDRVKPLRALFKNLKSDSEVNTLVNNIINHTGGTDYGAPGKYDYIGELCEINGMTGSGNDWEKEALIRNIANLITTQSNTFSVWGVSQSILKKKGNTNYGVFEPGDVVQSEKRFSSILERYVWPGRDGVPGNGSVDASGNYDKTARGTGTTNSYYYGGPAVGSLPWLGVPSPNIGGSALNGASWPAIDGPDAPTYPNVATFGNRSIPANAWGNESNSNYTSSSLESANNPLRAWMKYRMVDFHFLND